MSKTTYDHEDTSIIIRRTQQVLFVNVHIFTKQKNGFEKVNRELIYLQTITGETHCNASLLQRIKKPLHQK